jgi:hypothetical protein
MQKIDSKQGFPPRFGTRVTPRFNYVMQNPRSVSDLLSRTGNKLNTLKIRSAERASVLVLVRAALPARLAQAVVSAGVERGRLTIGVDGAAWASRVRYFSDSVRKGVGDPLGLEILGVRIRVVPPSP